MNNLTTKTNLSYNSRLPEFRENRYLRTSIEHSIVPHTTNISSNLSFNLPSNKLAQSTVFPSRTFLSTRQDFASRFPDDAWSIVVIYDLVKNGGNHLFSRDMIYEGSREETSAMGTGVEVSGWSEAARGASRADFRRGPRERRVMGIDHPPRARCSNFIA